LICAIAGARAAGNTVAELVTTTASSGIHTGVCAARGGDLCALFAGKDRTY
jgi:hypothetical protein